MRIITQDMKKSYEFSGIVLSVGIVSVFVSDDKQSVLGVYESHARAMEVFKDIHNEYEIGMKVYYMPKS